MFNQCTRVAITGIAGGGKTVFLSSLIAQLAEFDSANFRLKNNVKIHNFRELPVKSQKWKQFKFGTYRECLARGTWPQKTVDSAKYLCEYSRSDWERSFSFDRFTRQRLEILDFPGERIADATIAAYKHYTDWSHHILQHFTDHHEYNNHLKEYLQTIEKSNSSDITNITNAYKLLLARLIIDYKPLITPSIFLLSQSGEVAKSATAETIAQKQLSGLNKDLEFAPLPPKTLTAHPAILTHMEQAYKEYRESIALPLFTEISRASSLIILIDIPSLLAGGVDRYNDNRQILLDLFDALRPDSTLGGLLRQFWGLFRGSLKKVAFVASKMDMVSRSDIENGHLHGLLKLMTQRARRALPDVDFKWFTCSACHSTKTSIKPQHLIGKLLLNNPENEWIEYPVPALPDIWPVNWNYNDYPFYSILPNAPRNMQIPPYQLGLEKIFEYITEG